MINRRSLLKLASCLPFVNRIPQPPPQAVASECLEGTLPYPSPDMVQYGTTYTTDMVVSFDVYGFEDFSKPVKQWRAKNAEGHWEVNGHGEGT